MAEEKETNDKTGKTTPGKKSLERNWPGGQLVKKLQGSELRLPAIAKRYTEEQVKDVIWKMHGVRSLVSLELECTPRQLKYYLQEHPALKNELVEARNGIVDLAEEVIINSLKSEDPDIALDAAKTVLKQLGRNRGWGGTDSVVQVAVDTDPNTKQSKIMAIFGIPQKEE